MHSALSRRPSVCLSVCLSVCHERAACFSKCQEQITIIFILLLACFDFAWQANIQVSTNNIKMFDYLYQPFCVSSGGTEISTLPISSLFIFVVLHPTKSIYFNSLLPQTLSNNTSNICYQEYLHLTQQCQRKHNKVKSSFRLYYCTFSIIPAVILVIKTSPMRV